MSWKVVEKRIRKLIEEDKYLSPEGKRSLCTVQSGAGAEGFGAGTGKDGA